MQPDPQVTDQSTAETSKPAKRISRPPLPSDQHKAPQMAPSANVRSGTQTGPQVADASSGLKLLLDIEAQARRADSLGDLYLVIANETRKLTNARQIFVFQYGDRLRMTAISGVPRMDRNTPLIQEIECLLSRENVVASPAAARELALPDYPFPCLLWQPMVSKKGSLIGGFLLARENPWGEADTAIAERLAETYAHARSALSGTKERPPLRSLLRGKSRKVILGACMTALLIMAIPMPMSVLAPMEVVAHNPFIVSAPIEGVIEEVLVNPGDVVEKGHPLVRMGGTVLRNKLEVTEREVKVAEARLKKASQMAFSGEDDRSELRMAMADLQLKKSELKFAQDMFQRSVIRAERSGVAVLSDKQSLSGKPVVTGERIMQIADPKQVEINIQVPVRDSLVLKPNARVQVFLDSDPVNSREGKVVFGDYQALPLNGDQLAFRVVAKLDDQNLKQPRLGVRGTAQIYGERTLLGLYLFRRPLASLRQWIGL